MIYTAAGKARLGSPKAITAMAHKLARILWHLLKFKQPFNPAVFAQEEKNETPGARAPGSNGDNSQLPTRSKPM